jgi:dipicolinic acid synthetase A subunit
MKILVLGGDNRYISMMNNLTYDITCFGYDKDNLNENIKCKKLDDIDISTFDIVILPILGIKENKIKTMHEYILLPNDFFNYLKKDAIIYTGIINDEMKQLFSNNKLISFMSDPVVNKRNDILTIKGVMEDIKEKDKSNVLILGFGNLGCKLGSVLSNYNIKFGVNDEEILDLESDKFFLTTNKEAMKANFKNSSLIINTVPSNIIDEEIMSKTDAYILDIASFPYGINSTTAKKYNNYKQYSSIPSKYAPDKAGQILSKKLKRDLRGNI